MKTRPYRKRKGKAPRCEVVVETPSYDLTISKLHFGKLTLKMYTKGERVLRIEVFVHNTQTLRCGRRLERFPQKSPPPDPGRCGQTSDGSQAKNLGSYRRTLRSHPPKHVHSHG